jgi:hypothetical protein
MKSGVYAKHSFEIESKYIKRQAPYLKQVNISLLNPVNLQAVEVGIFRVKSDGELTEAEAELDEFCR